jgi:hypothetical protein
MRYSPAEAKYIMDQYSALSNDLYSVTKVLTLEDEANHISQRKVVTKFTVPVKFMTSIGCYTEYYIHHKGGFGIKEDLSNWAELNKVTTSSSNWRRISLNIKQFLDLPDWTEDMQPTITETIVTNK